ncbi:hypothetical protein C1886_15810 [Pseudomonas sp. FW300-N1A1]|uniref:hypothetical protein n=1 Tax=Pseudomonas sp. FW300-N1A1 TaxID=2075555 RepID=UPI000CD15216|nr:hypothetical protein [Pseudomonas sp. FW300-N1A1]POA18689.1 hypothetical protein C1886_15810 [Pseudomonas sp. FW300-N1A1]
MDENRNPNDASMRSGVAAPLMSHEFLSADDAARYAHEQVGKRRDREFVAMIIKLNNQRFAVTEPAEAETDAAKAPPLFPVDGMGRSIDPSNYQLHSLFYSHRALSTLDVTKVQELKWSRTDAIVSLQMFSVYELFHIVVQGTPVYLSGADESLLWFEPDSSHWQQFLSRLGTVSHPGPLARGVEDGSVLPGELVKQVAAAGELRIVIDNALWGNRGKVTDAWAPFPEPAEWRRPIQVAYGAIFSSADEAAHDRFSRGTGQNESEQTWFGFILKQQGKEEYIATELVAAGFGRDKLFARQSLFPRTREGLIYVYPESFQRHSYFYARQRVTQTWRPNRLWLAKHFIVPADLYVVVDDSKRPPVIEGPESIPTYIATQDGALLKYVARKSTKLFDDRTPNMGLEDIQSNLASEKLTQADFVRVVANSGELRVLHPNVCWDRKGLVDAQWAPAQNIERRRLGPVFPTQDDAALYARTNLPATTDSVFGGLILKRTDGMFVATEPVIAPQEDFDVNWIFPDESISAGLFPAGCSIVARYRSRHAREVPVLLSPSNKQLYLNMLSVDTVYTAFKRGSTLLDEYLFGPDGSVIRYRSGTWDRLRADLANALNDFKKLPPDLDSAWIKQRIHEGELKPSEWVDSLAKNGYLQVVAGSPVWGRPRAVSRFGVPSPERATHTYDQAGSEPLYGPVFTQNFDAGRYIHEQAGSRASQSFGFVLHREPHKVFFASLPIEVQQSKLAYDRVFPDGLVPQGYVVESLYLCAAQAPTASSDTVTQHFFSPMDVHLALARAHSNQGYLPVWFSCADGALLRFEMEYYDPAQAAFKPNPFASLEQANTDLRSIRLGTFSLQDYIRRMAMAGTLEVVVPSAFWGMGRIEHDWQPRQTGVAEQEIWGWRPHLPMGPIFHHADDAARYIQRRAGSAYEQSEVYKSAIVGKPDANSYCGVEPRVWRSDDNEVSERIFRTLSDPSTNRRNKPPVFPAGYELMASHHLYHSDATTLATDAEKIYASFVSPGQMYLYTHALQGKGFNIRAYYYSTPHGALLKYVPTYSTDEKTLLMTRQAEFVDGLWHTRLSTADFISRLANIGELRVLTAAHYWNQTGRLGSNWKGDRQQIPLAPVRFHRDEL